MLNNFTIFFFEIPGLNDEPRFMGKPPLNTIFMDLFYYSNNGVPAEVNSNWYKICGPFSCLINGKEVTLVHVRT